MGPDKPETEHGYVRGCAGGRPRKRLQDVVLTAQVADCGMIRRGGIPGSPDDKELGRPCEE
jgi:hypothetical protein